MKRLILVLVLFAVFLAICIFFSFLSPYSQLADSLTHFRLHLSLLLFVLSLLLAFTKFGEVAFVTGVLSFIGLMSLSPAFPDASVVLPKTYPPRENTAIKLIQMNLSFRNKSLDKVVTFLKKQKADFVTLQEVTNKNKVILERLSKLYQYQIICNFATVGSVAILSRHQITSSDDEGCTEKNGLVWAEIYIHGQYLTIGSLHLHWPYPYQQWSQITGLKSKLKKITRPILLGGDFNAAPWSNTVQKIAEYTDTKVVSGLRYTLFKKLIFFLPSIGLPIDHILMPERLKLIHIMVGPQIGSDHVPVIAWFDFKRKAS